MDQSDRKLHPLTIFEGPDCSGKSTIANHFRRRRGSQARMIHHGPYPNLDKGLPRRYVEEMMPMLLGYEEQIWDRCWLSEPIYGKAYRNGADRIGYINRRHLERFALRHGAVVVLCLPPWETVLEQWLNRKGEEYLEKESQLREVYETYKWMHLNTHLPVVWYDYTKHKEETLWHEIARVRPTVHKQLYVKSGGNLNAPVVLVGDRPSEPKDNDPVFQVPFVAFNGQGCSHWLTEQIFTNAREDQLLWVNASDNVSWLNDLHLGQVVALGNEASDALAKVGIRHDKVPHPQHHKRFNSGTRYPLLDILDDVFSTEV